VGEHREDAAVAVLALGHSELLQDAANVCFDGSLAEMEPLCDARVGKALSHELEHLARASSSSGSPSPCPENRQAIATWKA
jgi:hypothetical protein